MDIFNKMAGFNVGPIAIIILVIVILSIFFLFLCQMPITLFPHSQSISTIWEPTIPPAPVTNIFIIKYFIFSTNSIVHLKLLVSHDQVVL